MEGNLLVPYVVFYVSFKLPCGFLRFPQEMSLKICIKYRFKRQQVLRLNSFSWFCMFRGRTTQKVKINGVQNTGTDVQDREKDRNWRTKFSSISDHLGFTFLSGQWLGVSIPVAINRDHWCLSFAVLNVMKSNESRIVFRLCRIFQLSVSDAVCSSDVYEHETKY